MADDFGRQLLDALYGSPQEPQKREETNLLKQAEDLLRRRQNVGPFAGIGEAAATLGSGILASIPAGYAGLSALIPTRAGTGDLREAAKRVQDVQGALTYLPRSEAGQRKLEAVASALEPLGIPAKKIGDFIQEYTGSPVAGGVAQTVLDPVNLAGTGLPTKAAKAAIKAPAAVLDVALSGPPSGSLRAQRGAIKMKGGNWLAGEVETAVDPLKPRGPKESDREWILQHAQNQRELGQDPSRILAGLEAIPKNEALDRWIDKKLGGYIRNEMGTPEDPIRKLADQGITHYQGLRELLRPSGFGEDKRIAEGFPAKGFATTELGKNWEALTDSMIMPTRAADYEGSSIVNRNPWLAKVPGDTPIYETGSTFETRDLGFDHLIDVLKEDLATGRIRPEQLEKMSMEQAVRRAHQYDQEMAEKAAKATAAAREGLPVYKEYPQGYRWIELNKPGAFAAESDAMGHSVRGYEPPKGHPDWIEGSGDAGSLDYGHGGWEGIKSGQAKVYSLVDSKGAPHVTVEIEKKPLGSQDEIDWYLSQPEDVQNEITTKALQIHESDGAKRSAAEDRKDWPKSLGEAIRQRTGEPPPRITQIKGKQNRAPKEEYLPFVQDFVKSGQWSDVRDMQNTGLFKVTQGQRLPGFSKEIEPGFYTIDDFKRMAQENEMPQDIQDTWFKKLKDQSRYGYARGGSVRISDNPDTMRLELATGGAVKAALAAAKTAAKTATKEVAPQADALERARQNAVKMLNLPENNTPEMRAQAMGYIDYLHGTERLDRLLEGKTLDPRRATSGPMPYGTSTPELASNYAMSKADTSRRMTDEGDVRRYFEVAPKDIGLKGMRSPLPVEQAYYFMSPEQQAKIRELAPRVGYENLDDYSGKLIVHPPGVNATLNSSLWDWTMKNEAKGNPLSALRHMWYESGQLVHEPERLGDIFRLAGVDAPISQTKAPWTEAQGILLGKARITNPIDTSNTDQVAQIIQPLKEAFARDRSRKKIGPDQWGKDSRYTPREWVSELEKDLSQGNESYVWTSIPDKVTAELKRLGFNGIIDRSGKGGGAKEPVIIPFSPDQVRSRFAAFDPAELGKPDLLKATGGAIKAAAKAVKPSAEQAAKMASQQAEMALKNRAMQELKAQFEDLPLNQQPQGWMSPERLQQKIEEIRRREATPVGGQIPLLKKGGQVKFTGNLDAMRLAVQKRK